MRSKSGKTHEETETWCDTLRRAGSSDPLRTSGLVSAMACLVQSNKQAEAPPGGHQVQLVRWQALVQSNRQAVAPPLGTSGGFQVKCLVQFATGSLLPL
jgi:hypothetical protein